MDDGSGNGATQRHRSQLAQAVLTTLAEQENGSLRVKELFDDLAERLELGPEDLAPSPGVGSGSSSGTRTPTPTACRRPP
jgi:hypothetical protein